MHKDIAFTGYSQHHRAFLRPRTGIQPMFTEPAGMRIMRMPMKQITGHRKLLRSCGREGDHTSTSMLLDEKIASGEFEMMLRNEARVLEAILRVHVAGNDTPMPMKVLRSDHELLAYTQPK